MTSVSSLALFLAVGCGPPPLAHAAVSAESLAREVLRALSQRDEGRLRELALSEEEFERHVWPNLPAARPERNLPLSYVWGDLRQKSEAGLRRTMQGEGGRGLEFQSLRFAGQTTDHGSYRIHRDTVLTVRDSTGTMREVRVCGSMVEKDGRWKVFSYVFGED